MDISDLYEGGFGAGQNTWEKDKNHVRKKANLVMGDNGLWEHVSSCARVSSINHPQSAKQWSELLISIFVFILLIKIFNFSYLNFKISMFNFNSDSHWSRSNVTVLIYFHENGSTKLPHFYLVVKHVNDKNIWKFVMFIKNIL